MRKAALVLTTALMALTAGSAMAQSARFAHIFSDNAVLQRGEKVRLWGQAAPNEALSLSRDGKEIGSATADSYGRWTIWLEPMTPGAAFNLTLRGTTGETRLNNIAVGDVFLCSGQSNMEFQTRYATNAFTEIATSANPDLRFVTIPRASKPRPQADFDTPMRWDVVGPDTTGDSSAVCYQMAKELYKSEGVPIGMIHSSWGGTVAQAWISGTTLRTLGDYDVSLDALNLYADNPQKAQADWVGITQKWWEDGEPDFEAKKAWATPTFDDRSWGTIRTDVVWENSGIEALKNFDGVVWYRVEVNLTAAQAKNAQSISIGALDDADSTYVNGEFVGGTEGYMTPRTYAVRPGLLRAGKNVIAVRGLDSGGGGGLWGDPSMRGVNLSDGTKVPLPVEWKYNISASLRDIGRPPVTPWLPTSGLATLYNAMIAPLEGYTIRAAAWYQGESNTYSAEEYDVLLPALFADWRRAFSNPTLPFLVVQLADYGPVATQPGQSGWAELRESQRRTVNADPHAGLAVIIDYGDRLDIHPDNKTVVGKRLAREALRVVYGKDVKPGSPAPVKVARKGDDLEITFTHTGGGLVTYSGHVALAFETCTAAETCQWATALVTGPDTVTLKGGNAGNPVKVRYAWSESPFVNLFSGEDFPVVPFEMKVD